MSMYEDAAKAIRRDIKTSEINNFLGSLGDTPDQVADNVQGYNVTGVRSHGHDCPIANLVRKQFNATIVSVTAIEIVVVLQDGTRLRFITPQVIASFITKFDAGNYPKLEDTLKDESSINFSYLKTLVGQQVYVYAGANESFEIITKEELV